MTKEEFIGLIQSAQNFEKEVQVWEDFGINLYEKRPLADMAWRLFDSSINILFTTDGVDWINWWMFERFSILDGKPHKAFDRDDKEIPTETIDDLWNIIKDYQK